MKKQKNNLTFLICAIFFASLLFVVGTNQALAYGGATVSWTAPTTDEGGGDLTGLSGYRVYYSSSAIDCTAWDAASVSERLADSGTLLPATYRTVSGGSTDSYTFNNTAFLTPGSTYNFAVVAYDNADDVNLSKCAVTSGSATYVSKSVTYSGDIVVNNRVDSNDFTMLADDYGQDICGPTEKSDINNDCHVNTNDFTILADDYGKSF
ncbi:MAG TPA: fibronectin type III domain-containing protein [Candidatus Moranbacteria bacterium]|nr:fibronectin type III domain-containing protein [Candidatus Moranbacteria bacterium]